MNTRFLHSTRQLFLISLVILSSSLISSSRESILNIVIVPYCGENTFEISTQSFFNNLTKSLDCVIGREKYELNFSLQQSCTYNHSESDNFYFKFKLVQSGNSKNLAYDFFDPEGFLRDKGNLVSLRELSYNSQPLVESIFDAIRKIDHNMRPVQLKTLIECVDIKYGVDRGKHSLQKSSFLPDPKTDGKPGSNQELDEDLEPSTTPYSPEAIKNWWSGLSPAWQRAYNKALDPSIKNCSKSNTYFPEFWINKLFKNEFSVLDLSRCSLGEMVDIDFLKHLEIIEIRLNENNFQSVNGLSGFSNLKRLYLQNNRLSFQEIKNFLEKKSENVLPNLKVVLVDGNGLSNNEINTLNNINDINVRE